MGDSYLEEKKKKNFILIREKSADKLPGLGLVKHSSVSYLRNAAVETCWILFTVGGKWLHFKLHC